ncbi:MAG: hybrid sensor histidine kinase/response regulator [Anaerolineae bacterium]|nr:hybrid sensor histidine kinase/response regulator [Anaerolineae bacterium]
MEQSQLQSLEKPKVLVVDDKPANLYVMEKLLIPLEVQVITTTSPIDALGLATEHEFCLAIVDVQMPDMDGYELVELLRGNEATASMPVIFVSAIYSDEYHHRRGYDAGAVDFMTKPFIPEILLSKANVFLDLYRQRKQLQTLVKQLNDANVEITRFNLELEDKVRARTAELEKAYAHLELLDRSKSDFIQVISHELRTPLTIIQGYSQMFLREQMIRENEGFHQRIVGIISGAERLHEIVDSMLDMVKIDSGAMQLNFRKMSLPLLLIALAESLTKPLEERHLTLELQIKELPDIEADTDALRKLFTNLLLNAIKYTPDGGSITISGRCVGNQDTCGEFAEIVVGDTGIGIDPEFQEMIFTKFFRTGEVSFHSSGKTKFKGGGPGLGLSIAKGIAEAHDGRIWVESPGCDELTLPGSRFHVLLPLKQKPLAPEAADPARTLISKEI